MNILIIGGTGTISGAVSRLLCSRGQHPVLLNRGRHPQDIPEGAETIVCDVNDERQLRDAVAGRQFDVVCEFVGFKPEHVQRDYEIFAGKIRQYLYISSASAYNKPVRDYRITEGTTLSNPYWQYSRDKIACEEFLMKMYRENGFPVTIVRPSHTYCEKNVPVGVYGTKNSWQVLRRMQEGKPVIIHGDGTALWTMTWSDDFARGYVGLLGNLHAIGEAYQITTDESMTWNQIYEVIADELGVPLKACHVSSDFLIEARPPKDLEGTLLGDKSNTVVFDNRKIKAAVPGFRAETTMADGIRRAVRYVLAHPACQIADPEFDRWCDRIVLAREKALAYMNE